MDVRARIDIAAATPAMIRQAILQTRSRKGALLSSGLATAGSFFKAPELGPRDPGALALDVGCDVVVFSDDYSVQRIYVWTLIHALLEHDPTLAGHINNRVGVSPYHCGVLVNRNPGETRATDIAALAGWITERVFDRFGVELSQEPASL